MTSPARNPPKMGCTPKTSVVNAELNTINNVTVIMKAEGCPSSKAPVYLANRVKRYFIGTRVNMANAAVASSTHNAVRVDEALTRETL
jgi:hypothetical protein